MANKELKEFATAMADLAKEHRKTEAAQQKTEAAIADLAREHRKTEAAQQKTEATLNKLAEDHRKTEAAQQKTEAAIADLAREHRKTEAAIADLAREHCKTEAAQQKTEAAQQKTEAAQQKTEATLDRLAEAQRNTELTLNRVCRELGGLGHTQGEIAEDLFRRNIKELMRKWGIPLDNVHDRQRTDDSPEYDLVCKNGKLVLVVEVKSKLKHGDVKDFIQRQLPAFRRYFPQYKNHKLFGAVGGLVVQKEVEKMATRAGLFVLTQKGDDGAQIVNSPDFKPKPY